MKKSLFTVLAVLMIAAMVLAACGGAATPAPAPAAEAPAAEAPAAEAPAAEAPAAEAPADLLLQGEPALEVGHAQQAGVEQQLAQQAVARRGARGFRGHRRILS